MNQRTKKEKKKEYAEAKKRLEKSQSKYIKPKESTGKRKKLTKRELEERRRKRYHQRVWRGWRETDGVKYEVKTYNISELNNDKD